MVDGVTCRGVAAEVTEEDGTEREKRELSIKEPTPYQRVVYVRRKVRIRTILGFSCANLGS